MQYIENKNNKQSRSRTRKVGIEEKENRLRKTVRRMPSKNLKNKLRKIGDKNYYQERKINLETKNEFEDSFKSDPNIFQIAETT